MVCTDLAEIALGVEGGADLLGWKAMPLARDDLDSNYGRHIDQLMPTRRNKQSDEYGLEKHTLVSMFGEDEAMVVVRAAEQPQLRT